ncbi:unnamed protein product [Ostreobium quekettii]|uniref:Uncharacterized protein n=1 Tax=Ostreobium quekettii TaxID=121088 RepID=A0A8S1J7W6_9CHLO|nr:unnamed protein product [Ostreobium quekettii]
MVSQWMVALAALFLLEAVINVKGVSIVDRHFGMRQLLQADNLCQWISEEGICSPAIIPRIPDQSLLKKVVPTLCVLQQDKEECDELGKACRWTGGVCKPRTLDHLGECLDREYFLFQKGSRCQEDTPEFDDCNNEEACTWDSRKGECAQSPAIVDEILDNVDSIVAGELQTLLRCSGSTRRSACTGDCQYNLQAGVCNYPPFFDESRFFDKSKSRSIPICKFFRDVKKCAESKDCEEAKCQSTEQGCFVNDEAIIDSLYESDPDLQGQMKAAARDCPFIESEEDCIAYEA